MTEPAPTTPPPTPLASALKGLCPRCAAPTLYRGLASFQARCRACGLDYSTFNVGDGPAAFLTFLIGGLMTGLAMWLELAVEPPFWVHILLWLPITVIAVIGSLRLSKGLLLALEYKHRAREGRVTDR